MRQCRAAAGSGISTSLSNTIKNKIASRKILQLKAAHRTAAFDWISLMLICQAAFQFFLGSCNLKPLPQAASFFFGNFFDFF
jgi:hypothetical protein